MEERLPTAMAEDEAVPEPERRSLLKLAMEFITKAIGKTKANAGVGT